MSSGTNSAFLVSIESIDLYERDVRLRMPFRFGVVTLTEAPQAYAAFQKKQDGTVKVLFQP